MSKSDQQKVIELTSQNSFVNGYQIAMNLFKGQTELDSSELTRKMSAIGNPHRRLTGNHGKKLQASWHNGFRAGAKEAIRLANEVENAES